MSKIFYPIKWSYYLGEQRPLNQIVVGYQPDPTYWEVNVLDCDCNEQLSSQILKDTTGNVSGLTLNDYFTSSSYANTIFYLVSGTTSSTPDYTIDGGSFTSNSDCSLLNCWTCSSELDFVSTTSLSMSAATGTFSRALYTGYITNATWHTGTYLGNNYAVYSYYPGGTYYYTIAYQTSSGGGYQMVRTVGNFIYNGGTSVSTTFFTIRTPITDGTVFYPSSGGDSYSYISYPYPCP